MLSITWFFYVNYSVNLLASFFNSMIYSLSCLDEDDPEERRGIDVFFYFWIIDLRLVFYYWSSV